jgi:hypothetical protein
MKVLFVAAAAALALCACNKTDQAAPAASETMAAVSETEAAPGSDAAASDVVSEGPIVGGGSGPHGPPATPES